MHEYLWGELKGSKNDLQPWTKSPLYLANGEAALPLGWGNLCVDLQGKVSTLPVAVLGQEALVYGLVLGLDYISNVQMIINMADKVYSFLSSPSVTYPFQPGTASLPQNTPLKLNSNLHEAKPSQAQNLSLISSVPPPILTLEPVRLEAKYYINKAVSDAHLQDEVVLL